MKVLYVFIGIVVFVFIVFLPARGTKTNIVNNPPKNTIIVAFGDSLVKGVGATEGNGFVSILEDKIGIPIINHGVAGDTTRSALVRIKEVQREDPGVVLILLGGNDAIRKYALNETRSNLTEIINTLQADGALVVLLGIRSSLIGSGSYNKMFEKLSKNLGTLYVEDVLQGLFGNREFMSDTIHPNDKGYAIIANRIYEVLSPVIKKP